MSVLRGLLGGVSPDAFLAGTFEQASLWVRGAHPPLCAVLDPAGVLSLAAAAGARFPTTALASADRAVPPKSYTVDRRVIGERLLAEHAAGATVVLTDLSKRVPALAAACASLRDELGVRVGVNAYLSPAGASGFAPHWDTHDVFVVQVSGAKRWALYSEREPSPLERFGDAGRGSGEVSEEHVLEPGDVLYLPAGWVHAARAAAVPSLHLTIGLYPVRVLDVAVESVAARALLDPGLRRALRLPSGQASDGALLRVAAALRAVADDPVALSAAVAAAREQVGRRGSGAR